MLAILFIILLVIWFFGMMTGLLLRGFIHLLLVFAIIVLVLHLFRRRRRL